MDRDASSSDPSDEELVSRHVFALEQRVSHLENIIHHLSERLGQLEEQIRVAESHFTSAAQAAQEARYQASWGRLEVQLLARRVRECEQSLDLAALD